MPHSSQISSGVPEEESSHFHMLGVAHRIVDDGKRIVLGCRKNLIFKKKEFQNAAAPRPHLSISSTSSS